MAPLEEASTGPPGNALGSADIPVRQPEASETHAKKESPFNGELKVFIDSLREHYRVPGLSIGVVHDDETYLSGYGKASVEPSVDATEDTLFYIGSITKSIMGATLLHTLENDDSKRYTLDTKIRHILPNDFVTSDQHTTQHATLRDALHHRLGYPRHDISYGGKGFTAKDVVRLLRDLSISAELREKFQYCNMGYITLQHVIETLTGKFLGDVYDEAVFKPLGMSASASELKKARDSPHPLATGYSNTEDNPNNPQPEWDSLLIGQGGVISSARDMATYLRAIITRSGLPLSKDSYETLFTPGMIAGKPSSPEQSTQLYAAGWFVTTYRGRRFVFHSGAVPGFASVTGFFPDFKWGAVVLTNGDAGGMFASEAVFYKLIDDFLDVPEEDWVDYVKKWDGLMKGLQGAYPKSCDNLFPDVPNPPLPHSLPLEDYEGTYSHPGYQKVTFAITNPKGDLPVKEATTEVLHAVKTQSEWDVTFDLEHVSGEHFVCYLGTLLRSLLVQFVMRPCKAEFEIGADGKVSRLGIEVESPLGKVWFDKV